MPKPIRVAISGARGRMGRAVAAEIARTDRFTLVAGVARVPDAGGWAAAGGVVLREAADGAALLSEVDVVIDFSSPECLRTLLRLPREVWSSTTLVVGTTGLGEEEERLLDTVAETTPVLQAANFSVGVNLLLALSERAARVLGAGYDVEIVEVHHRRKADAPSGTALALGHAVAEARGTELDRVRRDGRSGRSGERPAGEIAFHSLRGGDVAGDHRVFFFGERERLELAHAATDRAVFADGALRAARWLVGRPARRYTMPDVLGLEW